MFKRSLLMVCCLLSVTGSTLFSQIKETQQIIEGWIDTEQLISEESSQWNIEKAALLDLQDALKRFLNWIVNLPYQRNKLAEQPSREVI